MVLLAPPDPRRTEINPIVRRLISEARERHGESLPWASQIEEELGRRSKGPEETT